MCPESLFNLELIWKFLWSVVSALLLPRTVHVNSIPVLKCLMLIILKYCIDVQIVKKKKFNIITSVISNNYTTVNEMQQVKKFWRNGKKGIKLKMSNILLLIGYFFNGKLIQTNFSAVFMYKKRLKCEDDNTERMESYLTHLNAGHHFQIVISKYQTKRYIIIYICIYKCTFERGIIKII